MADQVNADDRERLRALADDLQDSEIDDRGTPSQRRQILAGINARRDAAGRPPLTERAPEEGLYDRAKSLGMARIDR